MRPAVLLVSALLFFTACGDDGDNSPPTASNLQLTTDEDVPLTREINASDADGDALTVTLSTPEHGTVSLDGLRFTYTPAQDYHGPDHITAAISDGKDTTQIAIDITVTSVNDAPVAVADTFAGDEDVPLVVAQAALLANDTDVEGDTLTVTEVSNATHGTVAITGTDVTFTPDRDFFGAATFDYTISDGSATATATVTINFSGVNDPPNAVDDTFTTPEDTALQITTLTANDTDPEGQTLTITSVGNATNGTVSLSGQTVTFTPARDFNGTATFQYTISDGSLSDTGNVTVIVTPVNDPPVAVDDNATTDEDVVLVLAASTLLANDTDVETPNGLTITAVGNATNGTVTLTGTTIRFTPAQDFNGLAGFDYTVSDGADTDIGHVFVTVVPVNDAPIAVLDTKTTPEDTALSFPATDLTANDIDVDGTTPVVISVGNATNGTVTLIAGIILFTPAPDFNGTAGFDYTITDGELTAVGHVNVIVTPVNDAPIANPDSRTIEEDTPLTIATSVLLANDTDIDGPSPLTVVAVGNATNGVVVLNGTTITFTPAQDFNGTAGFDYTISDGLATAVGHVTVIVTPVNDAPVAVADAFSTPEDTALVITTAALTANDTDVDGPSLTVISVGNPTHGTVGLIGGTVTFTPDLDFNGTATFEYTVSDGFLSAVGLVTVTVIAVNDAPIAVDDNVVVQAGNSIVIPTAQLLANDIDVDGPSLSIPLVLNPVNGTVSLAGNLITFTPTPGFVGIASFEYVVSDGSLTDTGLVTVTVTAGAVCGDGVIAAPETCDDGNTANGDGCSSACTVENGFLCLGAPSACAPVCGDGIVVAGREACDDGNQDDTDGCTTQCVVGALCTATQFPNGDRFAVDPATGHCYVSFDDELTTFATAATACVNEGGYLATITSASEDAVVRSVQNPAQNPWIGAHDDAITDDAIFTWVTGEAFTFTHFAPGQPDDDVALGGGGDCLHLVNADGEWNDTNCNLATFVVGRICEVEANPCGDRVVQSSEGEECDDGNTASGDGCSATCQVEVGCGNGIIEPGEECDDDNVVGGDGCSATCQLEVGCGNGILEPGEQCDDDNIFSGDGCSSTCQIERLAVFSFNGSAGTETTFAADALVPGLASIPVMSRGAGVSPSAAANAFSASGWTTASTIDPTDFFAFTLTPEPGFTLTALQLVLDEQRSGTGPTQFVVRSSLDNFTANLGTFSTHTTFATTTISLTGFTNLPGAVTFRIFGFSAGAGAGTWRIDNVKVNGFTKAP
ncbi:MAG: tandem-95 repeat protein [Deltaproteobacteria bacterium]|nr:tandem-95 repeat protein [Deltaproteobacteria bacterium]